MTRIGPKMRQAAHYVRFHPGCTAYAVAKNVGPHGSTSYGYNIVVRTLAAGLIANSAPPGANSELHITNAGLREI